MASYESLHYEIGGAADGPALVLIHPLGGDLRVWDSVRQIWGDRYRVLAFDLPGAGNSPVPPAPHGPQTQVAELEALRVHLGVKQIIPIGIAVGAMLAASYAAAHPDRTIATVLCDPAVQISPAGREMTLKRIELIRAGGVEALTPAAVDLAFKDMPHGDFYNGYLERFRHQSARGYELNMLAAMEFNLVNDLPRIKCPTLVVTGESDVLFPPAVGKDVAEKIPGAIFREIQQAAHFPPAQNPAAFAVEVDSFLNQLSSKELS